MRTRARVLIVAALLLSSVPLVAVGTVTLTDTQCPPDGGCDANEGVFE
jgi:hypothetical protein